MIKEKDILLTTKDNPYNPFSDYDNWQYFDTIQKPYNTEAYVARVVGFLDPDLTEDEVAHERYKAFLEIISTNDELGVDMYVLVSRDGQRFDNTPSAFLGQE